MGFDKVVQPCGSLAPLERLARVLGERRSVVVVPSRLRQTAGEMMPRTCVVTNDDPSRGMTRSLQLALASIAPQEPFGVLLGDMPAMTEATILRTETVFCNEDADVAYPVDADGRAGHPVLFSPRTRPIVEELRSGDTLRQARDCRTLHRATWVCADRSAFLDLDVPSAWEAFAGA